jgi:hypothetical protein
MLSEMALKLKFLSSLPGQLIHWKLNSNRKAVCFGKEYWGLKASVSFVFV